MTKIFIFEKNNKICGWQVKGHSGYAEEGSDIVCASVSTASQMSLEVCQQAGVPVKSEVRKGFMMVEILDKVDSVQPTLQAMVKIFESLQNQYGKFVKMEVKKDVF